MKITRVHVRVKRLEDGGYLMSDRFQENSHFSRGRSGRHRDRRGLGQEALEESV